MGVEEDVRKIAKKLDKMVANGSVDQSSATDMLKRLQQLPIDLGILQKTRIGMSVNSLRKKTDDDQLGSLARMLVKSWKKLLDKDSGAANGDRKRQKVEGRDSAVDESSNAASEVVSINEDSRQSGDSGAGPCREEGSTAADNSRPSSPPDQGGGTSAPGDGGEAGGSPSHYDTLPASLNTSDPVRVKCRDLLVKALKTEPQPDSLVCPHDFLAAYIEDYIFGEFLNTETKYKNRIRSKISNLKDPRNPDLRQNVLNGIISSERFAQMSLEEMASDSMKELRQKLTKEAINDHQMAKNEGTKTDLLKCGRCRKNNCSYSQMQTRSADEPMTTFVLCNECGHRWKFC